MRALSVQQILDTQVLAESYLGAPFFPDYYIPGLSSGQVFTPFVDGTIVRDQTAFLLQGQNGGLVSSVINSVDLD